MNLFKDKGVIIKGVLSLTPTESFGVLQHGAVLVDLRESDFIGYKSFVVPQVVLLPLNEIINHYDILSAERYFILADSSGLTTREMVLFLQGKGIIHVAHMAGGFIEWERDGLPVSTDNTQMLSGACACQLKYRNREG